MPKRPAFNIDQPLQEGTIEQLRAQNTQALKRWNIRLYASGVALFIGMLVLMVLAADLPADAFIGYPCGVLTLGASIGYFMSWDRRLQVRADQRLLEAAPFEALGEITSSVSGSPACEAYLRKVGSQARALLLMEVDGLKRQLQLERSSADKNSVQQALCKYGVSLP